MPKDPIAATVTENVWFQLPPRTEDPAQLCGLIGGIPVWVDNGFCGMCDSRINGDWAMPQLNSNNYCELRHLTDHDIALLRPSERKFLIDWLVKNQAAATP